MFKSLPQEVAERRTNLYNELVAMIKPRLNPSSLSPFVTAETQRLAEHTATRIDIFLQALEAKATQPANQPMERLPALEFVPSPAQLPPSVVPVPITHRLPVIRVMDSGTAQNPVSLVSETDTDDEEYAQRSRSSQTRSRKPAQRSRSASPFESEDEFADDMQVLIDRLQATVDECDIE